ncbi:cytochrome d ubiquinol oxidase subunit II [Calycomorphotria hydatis]|nr:cytochrome d ubiquinol oxidase subunit II [Calycomorphotria hydatis]
MTETNHRPVVSFIHSGSVLFELTSIARRVLLISLAVVVLVLITRALSGAFAVRLSLLPNLLVGTVTMLPGWLAWSDFGSRLDSRINRRFVPVVSSAIILLPGLFSMLAVGRWDVLTISSMITLTASAALLIHRDLWFPQLAAPTTPAETASENDDAAIDEGLEQRLQRLAGIGQGSEEELEDEELADGADQADQTVQSVIETVSADGLRTLSGNRLLRFDSGERTQVLHLSFQPAFEHQPEITSNMESADIPATIRHTNIYPYGARVEVKLSEPVEDDCELHLEWRASEVAKS